ncbi:MAG: 8-amino-7-oxononanoate synthase [Cohaesibacter sp.]|jgi:8-amino-7-oxononanoate synthase|nr:8-amino-7-oxononanoate synthase [Cohaesibacter sp.]
MQKEPQQIAGASALARFSKTLERLEKRDQRRVLIPRAGLDYASNDYLGLAGDPAIKQALCDAMASGTPVGAGGSRLLRGNCAEHEKLEHKAARFFGAEQTLFFGAGYMANHALLTTLPRQGDLILYDELIHASSHDGIRGSKAHSQAARHNDPEAFEEAIKAWRAGGHKGQIWIALETLYSMDGDRADLLAFDAIAKRHDAFLILDEAHATGIFGPQGRGLSASLEGQDHVIAVHTCGKALGAQGALVCASKIICDYLINRCRPFIYATAPSPLNAVAICKALEIVEHEPERRETLFDLIAHAGLKLSELNNVIADQAGTEQQSEGPADQFAASGTQIQPLILRENARTMAMAAHLQAAGFDVRGIRPPTVPDGTARLRLALTIHNDPASLDLLFASLREGLGYKDDLL